MSAPCPSRTSAGINPFLLFHVQPYFSLQTVFIYMTIYACTVPHMFIDNHAPTVTPRGMSSLPPMCSAMMTVGSEYDSPVVGLSGRLGTVGWQYKSEVVQWL